MPEGETTALRAIVRGRVQGVGFRDYVFSRARFLRLSGYVRNLPDNGSVEVVAEGPREAVDQLLEYLYESPGTSRVDAVEVTWSDPTGTHKDFTVTL